MKAVLVTFFLLLGLLQVNGQNDSNNNASIDFSNKSKIVADSVIFPFKTVVFDSSKKVVVDSSKTKKKSSAVKVKGKKDSSEADQSFEFGIKGDTLFAKSKSSTNDGSAEKTKSVETNIPKKLHSLISFKKVFWTIIFILITHFLIKLLIIIVNRISEQTTSKRFKLKGISPFIRIVGWTIASIVIVRGVFSPSIETFIAIIASVGIAVGFAAQDILKNVFGGIMILMDRPFQIGDKIQVGEDYGEVIEIGMRSTRIVTKDDSVISLPNGEIINSAVSNSNSGEANCQVIAEIYLPIDIDTNLARQIATEAAQVSQYIYLNKPIAVRFSNEVKKGRSFIKMRLKAYVLDVRYEFVFQSDMTEIVLKEFLLQGLIKKEELM